jgi:hypothetical protein
MGTELPIDEINTLVVIIDHKVKRAGVKTIELLNIPLLL